MCNSKVVLFGFNRSILKCKSFILGKVAHKKHGLIEAYWNVNHMYRNSHSDGINGLIEAYWNVNCEACARAIVTAGGLIEAYWNVNI